MLLRPLFEKIFLIFLLIHFYALRRLYLHIAYINETIYHLQIIDSNWYFDACKKCIVLQLQHVTILLRMIIISFID